MNFIHEFNWQIYTSLCKNLQDKQPCMPDMQSRYHIFSLQCTLSKSDHQRFSHCCSTCRGTHLYLWKIHTRSQSSLLQQQKIQMRSVMEKLILVMSLLQMHLMNKNWAFYLFEARCYSQTRRELFQEPDAACHSECG